MRCQQEDRHFQIVDDPRSRKPGKAKPQIRGLLYRLKLFLWLTAHRILYSPSADKSLAPPSTSLPLNHQVPVMVSFWLDSMLASTSGPLHLLFSLLERLFSQVFCHLLRKTFPDPQSKRAIYHHTTLFEFFRRDHSLDHYLISFMCTRLFALCFISLTQQECKISETGALFSCLPLYLSTQNKVVEKWNQ